MKKNQSSLLKIVISLFAGSLLFILANPNLLFPKGLSFFAWICFVPLFYVIRNSSLKNALFFGFLYGLVSYAGLVYWLYNFSIGIFFLGVLFCAICYAVLFEILKLSDFLFDKINLQNFSWILQCFILVSFEFLKTKGFFGFSYGIIGYTQWENINLIQIADLGGVFAVSAILIFTSGVLYNLVFEYKRNRKKIIAPIILGIIFVLCIINGRKAKYSYNNYNKIQIAGIQHNENSKEDGLETYIENTKTLISLTNEAVFENPDIEIVVWPETAIVPSILYQYYNGTDSARKKYVSELLEYFNNSLPSFLVGNFHHEINNGKAVDYNSAMFFTRGKNVIPPNPEKYYKIHLVPISEDFPFLDKFPHLEEKLNSLGFSFWEKGDDYKVFEKDGFYFSSPICFENTFSDITRKMYQNGSRCFISLTNDSWAKSKAAQYQHLSMAVFRSVENKVPGVISATSGMTCGIMPSGEVIESAEPFTKSYSVVDVPVLSKDRKSTFYSEYGDVFAWVSVIISFALLIIVLIKCIIQVCQNR